MNIIISLGGYGKRFKENGYIDDKPFIKVLGKEMILCVIDSLILRNNDNIYIMCGEHIDYNRLKDILNTRKINIINLDKKTDGCAEAVYIGLSKIKNINKKTIVIDCDTFYNIDILKKFDDYSNNASFCFIDNNDSPIYSYIKIKNDIIIDITEKQKISNFANVGCYCFNNGEVLKYYCKEIIDKNIRYNNEYYMSCVMKEMIDNKHIFNPIVIDKNDFVCVGTPEQLKTYCLNNKASKLRICFDLDNTLVTYPQILGDYETVSPITENIEYLKYLKSLGHEIIINTARRMKTHNGNIGKIIKDIGEVTINSLKKFNIPYDELYFGKPFADFYIDDKAINTYNSLEKGIGIYREKDNSSFVKERPFNKITHTSMEIIVKKGRIDEISGEIYWYKNIPEGLSYLFPLLINHSDDSYTLEKINGTTLSHLYVDELLTEDIFLSFLNNISIIHNFPLSDFSNSFETLNIYENYSKKIKDRYNNYDYSSYKNHDSIYNSLINYFEKYESNDLGIKKIIHGDAVFTNCILKEQQDKFGEYNFKFIDMRGRLGNIKSIFGDVLYDYGKIYQSLIGYDEILLGKKVNDKYRNNLIKIFIDYVKNIFDNDAIDKIIMIANSLLFTLIPLHNNEKCKDYFNLICL